MTVDNAEEVINSVSEAVSDLNEDEQSADNLALVATAMSSLQDLVTTGQLIVTVNVSCCLLLLFCLFVFVFFFCCLLCCSCCCFFVLFFVVVLFCFVCKAYFQVEIIINDLF